MSENQRMEMMIRNSSRKLFVHKEADLTKPNVIAAIATAAGGMALAADPEVEASKQKVSDAVVQSYGAMENEMVQQMLDTMSPSDVKAVIGFSPDFTDFGHAYAVYKAQKEEYDQLFTLANQLEIHKEEKKSL